MSVSGSVAGYLGAPHSISACGHRVEFILCSPRQTVGETIMSDTSRVDPKLAAFFRGWRPGMAKYPPVRMEVPYEPHRQTVDAIALKATTGGPVMAETDRSLGGRAWSAHSVPALSAARK